MQLQYFRDTILDLIQSKQGSWELIVQKITDDGEAPKNWLTVRGVLQGLITSGVIERLPDVHSETYKLSKPLVALRRRECMLDVMVTPAEARLLNLINSYKQVAGPFESTRRITRIVRRSGRFFDLELHGVMETTNTVATKMTVSHKFDGTNEPDEVFESPAGETNEYQFQAWLPLAIIREHSNWCSSKIANMCDYPEMAREGDWSAIRDSDPETIWSIFQTNAHLWS